MVTNRDIIFKAIRSFFSTDYIKYNIKTNTYTSNSVTYNEKQLTKAILKALDECGFEVVSFYDTVIIKNLEKIAKED